MVLLAAGLSRAARANHQFIRGAVTRGLSSNEIGRQLRAQGRGLNRADLQNAVRHFRGIEDSGRALRSVRADTILDPARLKLTRGSHMSRNFAYDLSFPALDANGNTKTRYLRVISDEPLSREGLLDAAVDSLSTDDSDNKYGETTDFLAMSIIGGFRRG